VAHPRQRPSIYNTKTKSLPASIWFSNSHLTLEDQSTEEQLRQKLPIGKY
jgi:hypothetical protein